MSNLQERMLELGDDKDKVLAAVEDYCPAIEFAPDELKKDRDFMLSVVKQCGGYGLMYAHPD